MGAACILGSVEEDVLREIRPSPEERDRLREVAGRAVNLVQHALRQLGVEARVTIEGSYAKDTWLRGDVDLDVFLLLPEETCLETIESGLVEKLAALLSSTGVKVELRYAQHPYLRFMVDGVWVEAVPGCSVSDPSRPLTAVDRTPFHRIYVIEHTTPEMRDEIRLLKSFMKGVGVYGAELAVRGFSGYLTELLVIHYQCFRRVLEAALTWRPPVIIDVEGRHGRRELLKKFRGAAMIVPDPVDPGRNAAAAVSRRSIALFITAARLYLREPSKRFFRVPGEARVSPPLLPGSVVAAYGPRASNTVIIAMEPGRTLPPDNMWGIALRALRQARGLLERWGFRVLAASAHAGGEGRIALAIELESRLLPRYELHLGPHAWNGENAERFLEKYRRDTEALGPWVEEDGRLAVARPRRYRDAVELLRGRLAEWLPGSARGYRVEIAPLPAAASELRGEELEWLAREAARAPSWLKPGLSS
ncbi:hypothetical protein CF15_02800 [Pyrodictium occultum]|uniref:CCA-adding enzyme n=1 Tax=Pyrodictium occultum TaxID=2309 RepID=A0A0V8RUL9_PYROC|nr:CCA tRNA nucleotidyltransferase [Pyrodictium occultum]KSW11756.1 hypothetical protein CF15_02800 [Pyrodictium occultum]